jgi:YfiR/HmsC-like
MAILRWSAAAARVGALLVLAATAAGAQPVEARESEVKAAYLYNFAKYISWPEQTPPAESFRICVLADATFMKSLDAIVSGEVIGGRPVVRAVPESVSETRMCQILFVSRMELDRGQRLLDAVRDDPVLAVGDAPDFLTRGGAIVFVRDGDRLRFDVNMNEARRSRLTISSRLLRVARRVLPASDGTENRPPREARDRVGAVVCAAAGSTDDGGGTR